MLTPSTSADFHKGRGPQSNLHDTVSTLVEKDLESNEIMNYLQVIYFKNKFKPPQSD